MTTGLGRDLFVPSSMVPFLFKKKILADFEDRQWDWKRIPFHMKKFRIRRLYHAKDLTVEKILGGGF